jgi:hypothetical protein
MGAPKPLPSRLQAWVDARKRHRLSHAQVVSVEAEDVLDSFVGHIAGRAQPDQFATPGDWAILVEHADTYRRTAPWRRWTDQDHLDLVVRVDGTSARYVTIVIGAEGIQAAWSKIRARRCRTGWLAGGRAHRPWYRLETSYSTSTRRPRRRGSSWRMQPGTAGPSTPTSLRCG